MEQMWSSEVLQAEPDCWTDGALTGEDRFLRWLDPLRLPELPLCQRDICQAKDELRSVLFLPVPDFPADLQSAKQNHRTSIPRSGVHLGQRRGASETAGSPGGTADVAPAPPPPPPYTPSSTPQSTPRRRRLSPDSLSPPRARGARDMQSPKAKSTPTTPPPLVARKQAVDDIEDALEEKSVPSLTMCLMRTHRCRCNHLVFETVKRRRVKALKFLLEESNGADVNVDEQCLGCRPLHLAIQQCIVPNDIGYEMASLLLQHGAQPNRCVGDDDEVELPLHDAAKRGNIAAVALLLGKGASPNDVDAKGNAALHVVCMLAGLFHETASIRCAELLLKSGANPGQLNRAGLPPVSYCGYPGIRHTLEKAEHCWSERQLVRVCKWSFGTLETSVSHATVTVPTVLEAILPFL